MTTENITLTSLKADEGKWLTNGKTFGKTILLGINDTPSNWSEITNEEKEVLERENNDYMEQNDINDEYID